VRDNDDLRDLVVIMLGFNRETFFMHLVCCWSSPPFLLALVLPLPLRESSSIRFRGQVLESVVLRSVVGLFFVSRWNLRHQVPAGLFHLAVAGVLLR
jgi:hypothetical protein